MASNPWLSGITVATEVQQTSESFLLRKAETEYNGSHGLREIVLVWRKKRGTNGSDSFFSTQAFSHWGLKVVTPGETNGYVWELRIDQQSKQLLASASSLNVERPSWIGNGISQLSTGLTTPLSDVDIQTRAQIIVKDMRHPRLNDTERLYGEYDNNCQKFARSLAVTVSGDSAKMRAFLQQQRSFGDRNHDADLPYIGAGNNTFVRSEISSMHHPNKGLVWNTQQDVKSGSRSSPG